MATNAASDILKERFEECGKVIKSFAYFLACFCMIEDKAGGRAIPFALWPSQLAILGDILTAPRLIILKARQLGLTWLTAAYALWLCITRPLQLVVIISVNEDLAKEFLQRIKFIKDRLPAWLLPPVKNESLLSLSFSHADGLVSEIKSLPTTEMGAQSKTPTLLILDETARNRMVDGIYAASKPGIDAAKGRIIVISNSIKTAPGWSWTRGIYQGAMRGENDFKRIFMPWAACPSRPANFKELQIQQGMDEEDFSQHYPETEDEAISVYGGSFFGTILARHTQTMKGVRGTLTKVENEIKYIEDARGIGELWRYPYYLTNTGGWEDGVKWKNRYCIGSDVSEGLGQSYSVAYVLDRLKDEFVCRVRSNRVDAYQWADTLDLLSAFYERALVCVERTGPGQTTVKRLEELKANQYVRIISGTTGKGVTSEIGWSETQQSKWEACGDLKQWLKVMKGRLYCPILLDECSTFIKAEGTMRLEPEEGKLADCVMAAAMTKQADLFLPPPEKVLPPVTGWRKRIMDERKPSPWAM